MSIWGIRSLRCWHTCWRGRSRRPILDHRDTAMGLCRLARTVCAHSLRACRGAMARRRGQLAVPRYPVTPMLAHMLARAVDGTDFRPSRNGDGGCAGWRAQSASLGERWRDGAGCCLTSTLWRTRNQQTPYQCAHRMQISSTHRHESLKSHAKTTRCLSKAS